MPNAAACRSSARRSRVSGLLLPFDQLYLVAIGVIDKRDHRAAMRHRPGRARDLDAGLGEALAGRVDIGHADGEMAEPAAERVGLGLLPIMGQFDHRAVLLVAIADEGEGEL